MTAYHTALGSDPVTSGDRKAAEVAAKLHSLVQKVSIAAVHSEAESRVHAIIILAQAANGLLHLLASASMSETEEGKNPINSTAVLFAALLAYHTAPCEAEPGKVLAEFSPLIVFEALKDFERITRQQPDEYLNEVMCRVARNCASDPAMVAEVNKGRADVYRGGAQLN